MIDYNKLQGFNFTDMDGETFCLSDIDSYSVMEKLIKDFREISGYEDETMEGEEYSYNYEDFEEYARKQGYFVTFPQANYSVAF